MVATGKRWSHSAACYEAVETLSLDIQVVLMNGFHINNKFDYQIILLLQQIHYSRGFPKRAGMGCSSFYVCA